ncbi:MAG: hypothetical protein AAGK01_07020 [Pseudomonadota bacterium]
MRHEIPVVAIGKGDLDIAAKILFVDRPAALELNFPYVSGVALSILAAKDEVYSVVVNGKEGIVSALHGEGYQPLAIDDFNHLAGGALRRSCNITYRRQ